MPKQLLKLAQVGARITGEMSVKDIEVSHAVDIEALKEGDDDPLEVVVEVPVSQSTRGWHYTHEALRDIVDAVNERSLHGFLGHQKVEDVPNEFPTPVTHWIGAKMEEGAAYFRGIVDSTASDLKRWIKSGVVKNVSVFGDALLADSNGETHVVGYEPLSIDWTPLDRMGMPTRIVAVGEMRSVEEKSNEGGEGMNPEELLSNMKKMFANNQITPKMVGEALGVSAKELAGEMDSDFRKQQETADAVMKELSGEMDPVQATKDLKEKAVKYDELLRKQLVGEMAKKKLSNEQAAKDIQDSEKVLGLLWSNHSQGFEGGEKELSAEMDKFLDSAPVKELLGGYDLGDNQGELYLSGEMSGRENKESKFKGAKVTRASF